MMPWKLLALILIMSLVLVFIGFNLENRCDISLAFYTLTDVPVVITILASFLLGLLMAFPLSFARKSGRQKGLVRTGAGIRRVGSIEEQGPSFGLVPPTDKKTARRFSNREDSSDQD